MGSEMCIRDSAWQEDAFMVPWSNLDSYAFPPFALIRRVLNRLLASSGARMTLVAPFWQQKEWFPDLLSFLVDAPRKLPDWENLLRQPKSQIPPQRKVSEPSRLEVIQHLL